MQKQSGTAKRLQKGFQAVVAPVSRTLAPHQHPGKTSNLTKFETRIGQLLALTHALKPGVFWMFYGPTKSRAEIQGIRVANSGRLARSAELDLSARSAQKIATGPAAMS